MTGIQDQDPTNRWLTDQHANTRDGLANFLDLDTGLREAMLHSEHSRLLDRLSGKLDVETGLDAILSGSSAPEPPSPAPQTGSRQPVLVTAIKTIDPAMRMALRRDPIIPAVILSDFLVRALDIAGKVADHHDPAHTERVLVALGRDLVRARDRYITRYLDRDRTRDLDLDRALDLVRALALVLALDLARVFDGIVAPSLDFTLDLLARDLDIALDLGRARIVAQHMAAAAGRILGIQHVEGLAAALLDGALDDFTDADLTYADLAETDLTGVRWSVLGTNWPPGIDVDELRSRSRKVTSDDDIYVIVAPGNGKESCYGVRV